MQEWLVSVVEYLAVRTVTQKETIHRCRHRRHDSKNISQLVVVSFLEATDTEMTCDLRATDSNVMLTSRLLPHWFDDINAN